ncbi:MAG: TIGR04282 family arsenosugar biosynthesis glycosyltransferase [Gemmataceae bacterium]|nr:TIGR04282 family arsenosugar biosynthesis glycosyltransferase [Gemmataceae bacterium]
MTIPDWELGIFAKHPEPGRVKTRLARQTSLQWAAQLADAMLRDTLQRMRGAPVRRRVLAFAPENALPWFQELAEPAFHLTPQGTGDLGERMRHFFSQFLTASNRLVLIGSDTPTLPMEYVQRAFELLEEVDVVLGPAGDGGYYLIGCQARVPPVFDGIVWGSGEVLEHTVRRLQESKLRYELLPQWYDIDTLDDLRRLRDYLQTMRASGVDPHIPLTERILAGSV